MFELTNEQRKCFAITPVNHSWKLIKLKPSQYDTYDSYAYLDGTTVRKLITVGEKLYCERDLCETLSTDEKMLMPKTSKGKPVLLSSATLYKRTPINMSISYNDDYISVCNDNSNQCFYRSAYEELYPRNFNDFIKWLGEWCANTHEREQNDIDAFARKAKIHVKYKEGDFFRYRINRHLFGYGRIILDYGKMRKEQIPFWDIFMGKPLLVGIYHIVTERIDVKTEELDALMMLPSQMIMDNIFYYGECEIIGNQPIHPTADYYPIHYGHSVTSGDNRIMYQCGKTFLTLENGKELYPYFRHGGIGWDLNMCLPVLFDCITSNSNTPYWNQKHLYSVNEDLRNPKFKKELKKIQKQFGLI